MKKNLFKGFLSSEMKKVSVLEEYPDCLNWVYSNTEKTGQIA